MSNLVGYVDGGSLGNPGPSGIISSVELYNPATGTWTATTSMPDTDLGPRAIAIQSGQVFVSENLGLYTPATVTWSVVTNAPSSRGVGPLVLFSNNNVFVGGGGVFGDDVADPSTSQWVNIPPPPCTSTKQSCESAGVLLNTGKILVAGGATRFGVYLINCRSYLLINPCGRPENSYGQKV